MTAKDELWETAVDQYGYVTARDARALGIADPTVRMLVARGQIARAAHGVYRFPQLPETPYDPYMLAVLWTGTEGACLSHDTALASYDVCDVNPDKIHVTVPAARRIRRRGGERYVVHRADLADDQLAWWHRIKTVTLRTAIDQCITTGVPGYLLRQALARASEQGMLATGQAEALAERLERREAG